MVDASNDRYADAASLLKNAGGVFVALSQVGWFVGRGGW